MTYNLFILASVFIISCKSSSINQKVEIPENITTPIKIEATEASEYANTIRVEELKEDLYQFASDEMQGRETGEEGQKKAAEFLKQKYFNLGIPSPDGIDYLQKIPEEYFNGRAKASENVVAYLEGTEIPEELIVISAHYDHLGMDENGGIFNGADDDGSGNMAILQIAEAMIAAKKDGKGPKRSILFLHVTGEEKGLYGSKYYTDKPLFPLKNTIANLNIDMIGRVDDKHIDNANYVYLIGSGRLSADLHNISEAVNKKYQLLTLDYTFDDKNDPNRFYYRSDHYNFAKNNIPVIFYFNGVHSDYHKISDTPEKINYDLLAKRTKLVFYTAWELANRSKRISLISN